MNFNKLLLPAFVLVVLAQLFVPVKMIWDSETILSTGVEYKFRTAPVDPNDPFRGKYITLTFTTERYETEPGERWSKGDDIYVHLTTDEKGFAKISDVSPAPPMDDVDYVLASVRSVYGADKDQLRIRFPFDRYYMEESKAKPAERLYWESARDRNFEVYALVNVQEGEAVLKDVIVDGIPIRDLVETEAELEAVPVE